MNIIDDHSMLTVGSKLQMGKYQIESYLSSGGFGNTYVVTNLQFDEKFAMKEFFMKGISERDDNNTTVSVSNAMNQAQFDSQRVKFKKEARRLRKLNNANIVGVHDLFDENETSYYVMDIIDGESLSTRLKRTGDALTEAEATDILMQVLNALEEVHNQGIWHLDLKPGNIMVDKKGRAVLIDFGASKQLTGGESIVTTTSSMCYTPGYAPTEQIEQNMERIGPWTDFYALGATLYNLLTKLSPPSVSDIQDGEPFYYPYPISEKMQRLIEWMMTPNRSRRPQSVAEVRQFLDQADTLASSANDTYATVYGTVAPQAPQPTPTPSLRVERPNTPSKPVSKPASNPISKPAPNPAPKPVSSPSPVKARTDTPSLQQQVVQSNQAPLTSGGVGGGLLNIKTIAIAAAAVVAVILGIVFFASSSDKSADEDAAVVEENSNMVKDQDYDSALGMCSYTGPVDDQGIPHGKGEATFSDGRYYHGPFVHGVMDGDNAYFRYQNGDVFEGSFRGNTFLTGRYTIKEDGNYFLGTFKDGQPRFGTWYDKKGQKIE